MLYVPAENHCSSGINHCSSGMTDSSSENALSNGPPQQPFTVSCCYLTLYKRGEGFLNDENHCQIPSPDFIWCNITEMLPYENLGVGGVRSVGSFFFFLLYIRARGGGGDKTPNSGEARRNKKKNEVIYYFFAKKVAIINYFS